MAAFEFHGSNVVRVLRLGCVIAGATVGVIVGCEVGQAWFGTVGAIVTSIIGLAVGWRIGGWPDRLVHRSLFRELERSSNEELREKVSADHWNFANTLAMMYLAARGEEVRGELPRIVEMLESDCELTRMYGWDAFRLVFIQEIEMVADYDPRGETEHRRSEIAKLKGVELSVPDQTRMEGMIQFLRKQ